MNKESQIPYNLLAKYIAGECDSAETEKVLLWMNDSVANKKIFEELKQNWDLILPEHVVIPDKEQIWSDIQQNIAHKPIIRPTYSRSVLMRIAGIAALIALIAGFSASLFFRDNHTSEPQKIIIAAPAGQKTQLYLPDGTVVWLNSTSKITYYSDFNINSRKIELSGEAFFDVTRSEDFPFVVNSEGVDVKVLGTKFNIKAFDEDSMISVSLIEGRVNVLSSKDQLLLADLRPNETGEISKKNFSCTISTGNAEVESIWHLNQLFFDNKLSTEVWKRLEHWFGVKITVSNHKPGINYRFFIKTESLTEVLTLIDRLTPIEYEINGEEVTIRYK